MIVVVEKILWGGEWCLEPIVGAWRTEKLVVVVEKCGYEIRIQWIDEVPHFGTEESPPWLEMDEEV